MPATRLVDLMNYIVERGRDICECQKRGRTPTKPARCLRTWRGRGCAWGVTYGEQTLGGVIARAAVEPFIVRERPKVPAVDLAAVSEWLIHDG